MTRAASVILARITHFFEFYGYPLVVTSTDRSAFHNQEVGGVSASLHLVGRAADVVPAGWNQEGAYEVIAHVARFAGCSKALVEKDHVHLEFPA